jgi:D-alanyl-D-alanine carboxypeptidase
MQRRLFLGAVVSLLTLSGAARADEVDDFIKAELKRQRIPGLSLAVVRAGKLVKAEGYGLANLEVQAPATADTVYPLASVSKQFVAAGIMILVQDGKVELDEKLSKYLKDTPETWKDITIRQLLTHTSGMVRQDTLGMGVVATEMDHFKAVAKMKLDAAPGEKWSYSNSGFNLLGMVIHQVTGKEWDEFLRNQIFQPFAMTATRKFSMTEVVPNRASCYVRSDNNYRNAPVLERSLPAGGLLTTVKDLAKWDAALDSDKPLTKASRELMWTSGTLKDGSSIKAGGDAGYGFGWRIATVNGHKLVEHAGARPGSTSFMARYVDDKLTVIVMANVERAALPPLAQGVAGFYVAELKPQGKGPKP